MNCTRRCSRGGDSGSGCCRREPGPVIQLRASGDGARPASRWLSSSGTSFPSGHAVPREKPNKQRLVGSKIWKTKLHLSEFPSTPKTMQAEGFWEQPWQKTPVSKAKGASRACHQPLLGDCAPARKAVACPLPVSDTAPSHSRLRRGTRRGGTRSPLQCPWEGVYVRPSPPQRPCQWPVREAWRGAASELPTVEAESTGGNPSSRRGPFRQPQARSQCRQTRGLWGCGGGGACSLSSEHRTQQGPPAAWGRRVPLCVRARPSWLASPGPPRSWLTSWCAGSVRISLAVTTRDFLAGRPRAEAQGTSEVEGA